MAFDGDQTYTVTVVGKMSAADDNAMRPSAVQKRYTAVLYVFENSARIADMYLFVCLFVG